MAAHARSESARRVSDCVTALLRDQPFFGSLALRLPIRADATRETLASDGKDIRYAPQWVADTDADHGSRPRLRALSWPVRSNITPGGAAATPSAGNGPRSWSPTACCATQALHCHQRPRPGTASAPSRLTTGFPKRLTAGRTRIAPHHPGTKMATGARTTPNPTTAAAIRTLRRIQSDDAGPQEQDSTGASGGNAGSKPSGQTPASHDPCGTGEVINADERRDDTGQSGESPVDTPAEEQAWDEAMHQAASLARAQGNAPGAVEETIRQAHRSILDWRSLLRRYMTDAARRDYSWSVPNRRFIDSGLYLPSMHSQGIDAIAIIIDTSASLPGETLARFWAEVREIAAELQPESIYVLQVDAVLQDVAQYPTGELPDRISIKGRGGTDFRPGFAWLHEQGVRPGCCLYLTDMECDSYPEAEPGYPVVWVNWGAAGGPNREPWGERIDIGPA